MFRKRGFKKCLLLLLLLKPLMEMLCLGFYFFYKRQAAGLHVGKSLYLQEVFFFPHSKAQTEAVCFNTSLCLKIAE